MISSLFQGNHHVSRVRCDDACLLKISRLAAMTDRDKWSGVTMFGIPSRVFQTHECDDCGCKIIDPGLCDDCHREIGVGD